MDISTIIGLVLGFGAVIGGQLLEGGKIGAIMQPTAAIIILGGTMGATFVSFPINCILQALKDVKKTFFPPQTNHETIIKDMIGYAAKARKNGLISLEQESQNIKDVFIKKGISLVVDGIDPQKLRETMETELCIRGAQQDKRRSVRGRGGYAPTIGIIGAVLGLIQVMSNLSDSSKLGEGIAVAFVATIYGLMTANLVCLPMGSKLKHLIE